MISISYIIFAIFFTFVSSTEDTNILRITDSGSTNTAGYVIEVHRDGFVHWTLFPRNRPFFSTPPSTTTTQTSIQIAASRASGIFKAAEQAFPFNQYAPIFCIKSVSFGTLLHVTYNGQDTPDLNCPLKDQRLMTLNKYVKELISELHLHTLG